MSVQVRTSLDWKNKGAVESTIWLILKKNECTGWLSQKGVNCRSNQVKHTRGDSWSVYNEETSWLEIEQLYNKVQITGYTEERERLDFTREAAQFWKTILNWLID